MKKNKINYFIIIILLLLNLKSYSQTNYDIEKFDKILQQLNQDEEFNGNILVAKYGKIVFEKSYGYADFSTKRKLNINSIFELASLSKQFTAMGIYLLSKQNKLGLDENISKYIPELKIYKDIKISNLIYHTSGLPDYMKLFEEKWDKNKFATNKDIVELFQKYKPELNFKPNEKFQYSNTGYALLGLIIERVSKMKYEDFLKKNIFKPLKMENTLVYRSRFNPKKIENYALGYVLDSIDKIVLPNSFGKTYYTYYLDGIVGDGMVNSTIKDLFKWDRALKNDSFINKKDKEIIFKSSKLNNDSLTDYGFGWFVDNSNKENGKIVEHSGGWAGYVTHIERHLDEDITIIILQNLSTSNTIIPTKFSRQFIKKQELELPLKLEESILKSYSGTYINDKGKESNILFEKGKLWVQMSPEMKLQLKPRTKTKFVVIGFSPEVTYEFILDNEGNIENYRAQQPEQGIDFSAKRKNK
jgi:CubicO group peptidase (beta-lactamase class C family)